MSELTKRLREHAALHGDIGRFNDEQAQWERDLLDAADYIDNDEAKGVHSCHDHCQRTACILRRENTALRSRLAEAERDAARYRWLRVDPSLVVGPSYVLRRTDELDAAIDAFLAKLGGKP